MIRELGFVFVALGCGAPWLVACGETADPEPRAGGNPVVDEAPLEPGECGVARIVKLPATPVSARAAVTRQAASFSLGPWTTGEDSSGVSALLIDERGGQRVFEARGASNDLSWPMFLSEPDLVVQVFISPSSDSADDSFDSRAWSNGEAAPHERGHVLSARWRGTNSLAFIPALDGRSAVFAIWPQALSEPRAAVLGPDGARRGEVHAFSAPDAFASCPAVTPTAHGAFVSFTDSSQDLRLFELGPDGQLVREAKWRLPSAVRACPSFALAEGGLVFWLDLAAMGQPADVKLYRLAADGAVAEVALPSPSDAREVAMLGDAPLFLVASPGQTELYQPLSGERWPVTLPAGTRARVPSEPGSMWLDVSAPDEARTLVQLSCR